MFTFRLGGTLLPLLSPASRTLHVARSIHVVAAGWGTGGGGRASGGRGRGNGRVGRGGGGRRSPLRRPLQPRRPPPPPEDPFDAFDLSGDIFYFATCHPGLEPAVAAELARPAVGARAVRVGVGGVAFSGDAATGYAACLWLRCAIRVLRLVARGSLDGSGRGGDRLYDFTRRAADWPSLVPPSSTIAVDARVGACDDLNAQLAITMVRNAVCDAVRDATGVRPAPPGEVGGKVDVPLFIAAHRDRAWLYRDMAGVSLHKRGYRRNAPVHRAALNEAAAAAVLHTAGWNDAAWRDDGPPLPTLADPMCGSGTLLIEAALTARRLAPGLARGDAFPFVGWPDFDAGTWHRARAEATAAARPDVHPTLLGNDVHAGALSLAESGAAAAGVDDCISLHRGDTRGWTPTPRPTLVVTNPPWGKRLAYDGGDEGDDGNVNDAWPSLGEFLRVAASPCDVFVVCGDPSASRGLRMKAAARTPLSLGGEDVRLLHYVVLPPLERVERRVERAGAPET